MKYFLLITALYLIVQNAVYAQVHGTYPNDHVSLSLLQITGAGLTDTLETVTTQSGRFRFNTQVQETGIYVLSLHDAGWGIPMLLEPGESRILIPDLKTISVHSGKLQKKVTACNEQLKKLSEKQSAINKQLRQEKDQVKQQALQEKQQQLKQQYNELLIRYIRTNKSNMAGTFLVWDKMEWVDFQVLEERFLLLDQNMQNSTAGNAIRQEIDRRWKLKPGIIARDFTIPDTTGQPVTLSHIQAKVKILDFWASWCIPCRMTNKKLIALYEKYKSQGLEIISISVDKNEEQWKKAIRQDGCNWIHLSELNTDNSAVHNLYKISSIPACFLLDENNRCLATGIQSENLEEIIQQALKRSSEI